MRKLNEEHQKELLIQLLYALLPSRWKKIFSETLVTAGLGPSLRHLYRCSGRVGNNYRSQCSPGIA